jgi:hypothetical protein
MENNNGNVLIAGKDLSSEQIASLSFKGASNPEWIKSHKFWFKDGKPSTEQGFYYPVVKSLSFLPY